MNLLRGFFQLGFVALDLDAATAMLAERYGIKKFRRKRSTEWMDAAHAYAGGVMIELMVLTDGAPALYSGYEPQSRSGIRLHHHGYLVEDDAQWTALEQMVRQTGLEMPMGGSSPDGHFRFMYLDTRSDLGLYTEYVYQTGPAAGRYDDVPHN